jgi:phenylacetate-CoA ligase
LSYDEYPGLVYRLLGMEATARRSREAVLALQRERLRRLVRYAYRRSSFYRSYYAASGITERDIEHIDIGQLPPIDKKLFVENFDGIVTTGRLTADGVQRFARGAGGSDELYLGRYRVIRSSGSTGTPTFFVYDERSLETVLAAAVRAVLAGVRVRDVLPAALPGAREGIRVLYLAATGARYAGAVFAGEVRSGILTKALLVDVNSPLEEWPEQIARFRPNIVAGYPSAVELLAGIVERAGPKPRLYAVITAGEPLTRPRAAYLESVFGTEILNAYGSSESVLLGLQKRIFGGMYLFDDLNYVEIGEKDTLLTPLYNYTQPLIRYRLTDILREKGRGAHELLPFSKIDKVMGRAEELLWLTNQAGQEDFLHPLVLDDLEIPGITGYRFLQRSRSSFDIQVVLAPGASLEQVQRLVRDQMGRLLRQKRMSNLSYRIESIDSIPVNPRTGKQSLIVTSTQQAA